VGEKVMQQMQSNDQARQPVVPQCYEQWVRESDIARRKLTEEKVFQISRMCPGDKEPLVIATCGKTAAQRLMAAFSTQDGSGDRYKITAVFVNAVLPGFER
jgi:transcription elongation factor GreA-like protein